MKKIQFNIVINASAAKVYDFMLGISDKKTYEHWTSTFNPTSSYSGGWVVGGKMLFTGEDDNGEAGGMVSEIEDVKLNKFVSIRHCGILKNGKEVTSGPDVEGWVGCYENYYFEEENGATKLTVKLDIVDEFTDYMNQMYPKALSKLKEICEE
jgi:hypothetical protein